VWFRWWTVVRWSAAIGGIVAALAGSAAVGVVLVAAGEVVGRWLFFVTVVPLNMPGSFFRGTVAGHR
jgi:DMSO reductase anchor subunit